MSESTVVKEVDRSRDEALWRALDFHRQYESAGVTPEKIIATAKKFHGFLLGKK